MLNNIDNQWNSKHPPFKRLREKYSLRPFLGAS